MITFHTDDLSYWPLLRRLDLKILEQLDKFYIYGNGYNALIWTNDGRVFQFKKFFLSDEMDELNELPELKGVQVIQAEAYDHTAVFVLDSDGCLFGWGTNDFKNVGVSGHGEIERPVVVKTGIRLVRCEETSTVALGLDQVLWRWGDISEDKRSSPPQRWNLGPVIDVHCLGEKVLAVSHTGAVVFYYDDFYTEDIARLGCKESTYPIRLPPKITAQALCLLNGFFLLLTDDGEVYHHEYPSDEFGFRPIQSKPFKIPIGEPIKHMVAIKLDPSFQSINKGILIADSGKNYLYSCYNSHRCGWVLASSHVSVADLYSLHCELEETPNITTISPKAFHLITDFNNPLLQDSVPLACGEGNYKARCVQAKQSVLQEKMKSHYYSQIKFGCLQYRLHLFHYAPMFHYIRFLHTGEVDTKNELILHMFVMAHYYHNSSLMKIVVDTLSHHIIQRYVTDPFQVGVYLCQCLLALPLVDENLLCKYQQLLQLPNQSSNFTGGHVQSLGACIVRFIVQRGLQLLLYHSGYYEYPIPSINFNVIFDSSTKLDHEEFERMLTN